MTTLLPRDHPDWGWEFHMEDFVFERLAAERADAQALEGDARQAVLDRVDALWRMAAWHSAYVDDQGVSAGRCFSCPPTLGCPCVTMSCLARIWRTHPAYLPAWAERADGDQFIAAEIATGGFRRAYLARTASSAPTADHRGEADA